MQTNGGPKRAHITKAVRKAVLEQFEQQGRICALCEGVVGATEKTHLDHIIPVSKGGTSDPANLRYIHASCNASKGKHLDEEYMEIMDQRELSFMSGEFDGFPDDRPDDFTEKWHSRLKGHEMALLRRSYGFGYGLMFHMTCSCGWSSERYRLEIDAGAQGLIHEHQMCQQKKPNPELRFRDHILSVSTFRAPGFLNLMDERKIGRCACGWACVEQTEDKLDDAYEKHWMSLLIDPDMKADYLAFLSEEGYELPED